jgi:hypothetical protein
MLFSAIYCEQMNKQVLRMVVVMESGMVIVNVEIISNVIERPCGVRQSVSCYE